MAQEAFDALPSLRVFVCLETSGKSELANCDHLADNDRNSARKIFTMCIDRSKCIEEILGLWKEGRGNVWSRIEGSKVLKSCEGLKNCKSCITPE